MRILGFVILAMCLLAGAVQPSIAGGDSYPSRPVKFIIPANKGGGTDVSFAASRARWNRCSARKSRSQTCPRTAAWRD